MAPEILFWSSSVKYLGRAHLGRAVEPENTIECYIIED